MNRHKLNDSGMMNPLLIPVLLLAVFFVLTSGFAVWAFAGMQDYKNNTDQKVAAAVQKANDASKVAKDAEFAERDKLPNKEYRGPDAYGRVTFSYPKTWNVYADERGGSSSIPLNVYVHPNKVPSVETGAAYALRVQVVNEAYDNQLATFEGNIKSGLIKSSPFRAALVPDQLGVRLDGQISSKTTGSIILIPLRDKTLRIYSETQELAKDFNETVLTSLKFVP